MGIARRQYSPDEKKKIMEMHSEGWTYKDIAAKIRPGVKSAWRSVGDIVRQQREDSSPTNDMMSEPRTVIENAVNTPPAPNPISHLRPQTASSVALPEGMADSLTAKEFMTMIDDDQRAIFVATYEDLRGEADEEQLTKAENEMLIRAAYSNVKYLKAQAMLSRCETYLMMDLDGYLGNSDEDKAKKRLAGRGDAYKKESEQYHKEYLDLLDGLKLTRKQRLDKIKDTRNTFLDLQAELMDKARQDSIVEEIKRINLATKDEFIRMSLGEAGPDGVVHSWLIGSFDSIITEEDKERYKEWQKAEAEKKKK